MSGFRCIIWSAAFAVYLFAGASQALAGDVKSRAIEAINAKDYTGAIKLLERASDQNPYDDEIKKLTGQAYAARGWDKANANDLEGAMSDLKRARVIEPEKQSDTYLGLGYVAFRLKKYDDALYYLFDQVYLDPKDGRGHQVIGEIYYQRGKLEDSIREWELALSLMPGDEDVMARLAKANKELGVEGSFTNRETFYFNIKYEGEEKRDLGEEVLDTMTRAYSDVGGELDSYPREPVNVILYTRKQFNDLTEAPAWSGGVFDGNIRIPIGGGNINREALKAVLYHEYTHSVIHRIVGGRVPTWLDEGIAQYEEHWVHNQKTSLGRTGLMPLEALDGPFIGLSDPEKAKLAYMESLSAVQYYVDRFGKYNLSKMLRLLGEGRDLPEAFHDTTGISIRDFEGLWLNSLRGA